MTYLAKVISLDASVHCRTAVTEDGFSRRQEPLAPQSHLTLEAKGIQAMKQLASMLRDRVEPTGLAMP